MVKIRSIQGQKFGVVEGEKFRGREESRGTRKEACSRHPGLGESDSQDLKYDYFGFSFQY